MIVGGVLEPIKDYFGTVENQGRGSLHLHLLIWLDHDMKPVDMKKNIRNTDFREKLKAYLEDIIKEDLDQFKDEYVFENFDVANTWSTPSRLTRDNIHAVISTMAPMKELSSSSIFHASPSANKLLRTLTHDRLKSDVKDDDVYDNEETINGDDNNDEEHFQIQSAESDKKYVLANTRVDYQYRFEILKDICLYDFVSTLYKKKMTATDLKYLSTTAVSIEENVNQKGRPPNERYPFQKQHPQTTAYLMLKYSNLHVPILYGPQIPSRDRDETRERYSRALLTLFVPWRTVADLCDCNQTWEYALKSRQHLISTYSQKIIENIQLLHECKKNRDEHIAC
ncbi:unnamed protein product, partial [Rotaria socialis]